MRRLRHAGKPCKYEFSIGDVIVRLSPAHSKAITIDNLQLTWQRGHRTTAPRKIRVVEKLDQSSGELSRTAHMVMDLTIPCTLYRVGSEADGRFAWRC